MEREVDYHNLHHKIRELENELRKSNNRYAEFKKHFMSSLSHELRTPLNSILGFSKLLADNKLNHQQKDEYYTYISLGSERLIILINEMIQLTIINTEKVEPDKGRFNLSKMFDVLYNEFNDKLNQRPHNQILLIKRKDIDNNNFNIFSDENLLMQLFNLLLNHTFRNTAEGIVEFGYLFLDLNYIQFYIEDKRDSSFKMVKDLLYEADEKDDKELFGFTNPNSAGFALTISKKIIEALGGEIWMKCNDYNGFTINFIIPVNDQAVELKKEKCLERSKTNRV